MTAPGDLIDKKFEVLSQAGKGGMSRVWLVRDRRLNKLWAAKEIRRSESGAAGSVVYQSLVAEANLYIENSAPWALAKDPAKAEELAFVIWGLIEAIRIAATLLAPFTPATSAEVMKRIGLAGEGAGAQGLLLEDACVWGLFEGGAPVEKGAALFPRLAEEDLPCA